VVKIGRRLVMDVMQEGEGRVVRMWKCLMRSIQKLTVENVCLGVLIDKFLFSNA
jgi:hypothetical protein